MEGLAAGRQRTLSRNISLSSLCVYSLSHRLTSPPLINRHIPHLHAHTRSHRLTHLLHPKTIPLRRRTPQLLLSTHSTNTLGSIAPDQVLNGQPSITRSLENTTGLESPRHLALRARKEEPHLERIAHDPVCNNTGPEALASSPLPVGKQLRQRQRSLNRQRDRAEEIRIRNKQARGAQQQVQNQQDAGEVRDEAPVRARAAPLPEVVRPFAGCRREGVLERLVCMRGGCAVRECDVQEEDLHEDREERLDEERGAEVGAEPVEDPVIMSASTRRGAVGRGLLQDTGDQHDQRDVQRESGAAARLVDRVDLVRIAGDGACCDEHGRDVLDYGVETEHCVRCGTSESCGPPTCFDARTPRACRSGRGEAVVLTNRERLTCQPETIACRLLVLDTRHRHAKRRICVGVTAQSKIGSKQGWRVSCR